MKSLDGNDSAKKTEKAVTVSILAEEKPVEKIDFSNVKIEPFFEEMIDFERKEIKLLF